MREAPKLVGLKVLLLFMAYLRSWMVWICSWIVLSVPIWFFYIWVMSYDSVR